MTFTVKKVPDIEPDFCPLVSEGTEFLIDSPRPSAILRVIAKALAHDADPLAKLVGLLHTT
jgi:hypothetical protein